MVGRGVWILLASAMMSGLGLPAMARVDPQEQAQGRDPSPRVVRFDIPPQDLDTAMTRLADQAGIRLLGASSDLAGKRTAGLSGDYTITQALNALLAGSGVGWRFSEANTVVLERLAPASSAMQLDPVQVQGRFPVPPQAMHRQPAAALRRRPGGDRRAGRHSGRARLHGHAVQPDATTRRR